MESGNFEPFFLFFLANSVSSFILYYFSSAYDNESFNEMYNEKLDWILSKINKMEIDISEIHQAIDDIQNKEITK